MWTALSVSGHSREKTYQDGLTYADDEGKWTPGEDGCYYYSDVVPAGGETQELRIGIDHMDREESFNVIVVQESTPVLYDEQGQSVRGLEPCDGFRRDSLHRGG